MSLSRQFAGFPFDNLKLKMKLTLYVRDNCPSCERVKNRLSAILKHKNFVDLRINNLVHHPCNGLVIVPALFIEDELYSYGEIDENKFLSLCSFLNNKCS